MLTNAMKMYATGTPVDSWAILESRDDCVIQGILFSARVTGVATTEGLQVEVSFASTSGFISNDTVASVAGVQIYAEGTVSGVVSENLFVGGLLVPVAMGERLYLHGLGFGTVTATVSAWIYCIGRGGMRASDRRKA